MTTVLILGYVAALILAAYYVGRNVPIRGVLLFIAGIAVGQFVMAGPASFWDGGCRMVTANIGDC